jgi:hypothetical protein
VKLNRWTASASAAAWVVEEDAAGDPVASDGELEHEAARRAAEAVSARRVSVLREGTARIEAT